MQYQILLLRCNVGVQLCLANGWSVSESHFSVASLERTGNLSSTMTCQASRYNIRWSAIGELPVDGCDNNALVGMLLIETIM